MPLVPHTDLPPAAAAEEADGATFAHEPWPLVRLDSLFEIQQGKALSPKTRQGRSPAPFLRTANILWGRVDLEALDAMDFSDAEIQKLRLRSGDLLVCEGGDVGRTAIWRGEIGTCAHQNHVHRLRAKNGGVEPEFYMYWMQAAIRLLGLYGGEGNRTTIPNLSKARLGAFAVPLPPLDEQRRIARVLATIQRAMEAQDKVIAAARELKRSLMKHLFTYGPVPVTEASRVPLKETEIGPVPEHWEVVQLGQLLKVAQYGLSLRGSPAGQIPILRMNSLRDGRVSATDLQYVDINSGLLAKFQVNRGDVLFNRTNSMDLVGKTGLFDLSGQFVFASYLLRLVTDGNQLLPQVLTYYLNQDAAQQRLKGLATRGVSQSNISATRLRTFVLPRPPLEEQDKIARELAGVDGKIDAEEKRKAALEALFKSMLHHLMTGKIRVPAGPMGDAAQGMAATLTESDAGRLPAV